ncbi:4'-phosphopantetheinyl transferase A [Penicillium capsulatum]|uniref:holo-[acyl-carrier-protein] synthase n=1 Tax=Penicillium capsulatum TaxID=69766 RepID=A0A9W9LQ14_9EURO|nr:4'-phosphopantetheinyl transferase A [Penicillium capsulatum]KAJ6136453.1 4'-phosphopantetheinyl transferase A [Penicillium capsulatum]
MANEFSGANVLQSTPNADHVDASLLGLPTLVRWYIDIREWENNGLDLPLLEALRPSEQEAVKRYHHAADRRMSLASHLLKYFYIHHACGKPWKDILLSRTAMPENRPHFISTSPPHLDFNVSHQAGLTILAGTIAPVLEECQKKALGTNPPRLGIDVTCANERRKPIATTRELVEFVSIFSEVFSDRELATMKNPLPTLNRARDLGLANAFPKNANGSGVDSQETIARFGLRLFYSYWALKEAYLKMTGDALLATWVRSLEFTNVIPPDPVEPLAVPKPYGLSQDPKHIPRSSRNWGKPYTDVQATRDGESIDDVRIELVAFETDYIVATAGRGAPVGVFPKEPENRAQNDLPDRFVICSSEGKEEHRIPLTAKRVVGDMDPWHVPYAIADPWLPLQEINVNLDVRACAEGRCVHPTGSKNILASVHVREGT